jgi:DNA-binding NarL/FixJ family response regulator
MNNGADGYLLKEDANAILHSAIKAIRHGKTFISPLIFGSAPKRAGSAGPGWLP